MSTRKSISGKTSLIKHIEIVSQKAKDSGFNLTALKDVQENIKEIAAFLGCTNRQALIFSIVFCLNFSNYSISFENIADYVKCNPLKIALMMKDFDALERKHLIRQDDARRRKSTLGSITFHISKDMMDNIFNNKKNEKKYENLQVAEFLGVLNGLFEEKMYECEIKYSEMVEETKYLIMKNSGLDFVKKLKKLQLEEEDTMMLIFVCCEIISGNNTIDLSHACDRVFDETAQKFNVKRSIVKSHSNLIKQGIIELIDRGFKTDREIGLTDKGMELLFSDNLDIIQNNKINNRSFEILKNIPEKRLYYNPEEEKNIDFLRNVLNPCNFDNLQIRLKKNNMNKGLSVLFYGYPGTGKTETAYQLAKQSGRQIMMVDISKTKTCWFGESEKLIKAVFDDYRKEVEKSKIAPILLFNEADGIFAKRKENGHSNVDQTENAIQNIILQELENLNGIMIATTNLTNNLDKAFERRFLYKIEFHKPNLNARISIWKDKISSLNDKTAKNLSEKYDLSGGQIDNIAKKHMMKTVLENKKVQISELEAYCREESSLTKQNKIGF